MYETIMSLTQPIYVG